MNFFYLIALSFSFKFITCAETSNLLSSKTVDKNAGFQNFRLGIKESYIAESIVYDAQLMSSMQKSQIKKAYAVGLLMVDVFKRSYNSELYKLRESMPEASNMLLSEAVASRLDAELKGLFDEFIRDNGQIRTLITKEDVMSFEALDDFCSFLVKNYLDKPNGGNLFSAAYMHSVLPVQIFANVSLAIFHIKAPNFVSLHNYLYDAKSYHDNGCLALATVKELELLVLEDLKAFASQYCHEFRGDDFTPIISLQQADEFSTKEYIHIVCPADLDVNDILDHFIHHYDLNDDFEVSFLLKNYFRTYDFPEVSRKFTDKLPIAIRQVLPVVSNEEIGCVIQFSFSAELSAFEKKRPIIIFFVKKDMIEEAVEAMNHGLLDFFVFINKRTIHNLQLIIVQPDI